MVAFPKYESYQDTGEEWLGEIPQHWQLLRTKNIFRLVTEPAPKNNDEELLSVYSDIGVKPRRELEERGNKASTTDGYWFVKKGDVIVNKLLAWMGAIGVSDYDGVTSPAYDILRAYKPIDSKFYHYLFRNPICISKLKQHSKGIMEMRLRLYFDEFGNIKIPYPPIEDQQRIVEFLDRKTSEIDQAIAQKQRLIELLQEQKAILINQAVTKGLKLNVPMCDRGIEGIGDIPKHWEVMRLKFLMTHIVDCLHSTPDYVEDGQYPAIRTADVSPGILNIQDAKRVGYADYVERIQRLKPQENDIIYSRDGERYGMAALVPAGIDLCLAQRVMMFRIKSQYTAKYFMWALNSECVYGQVKKDTVGATSPRVNIETIKETWLPVPPQNEQVEISDKISKLCHERELVIDAIRRNIEELEGYRTSLINATVTGKIKV